MSDRQRVLGAMPVGPTWTIEQVRERLRDRELVGERIVEIPVSIADLDPELARKKARRQKSWFAILPFVALAAALFIILRPGGGGWSALMSPLFFWLLFGPVVFAQRPRVGTAVRENSEAESFVRALTDATSQTRGVRTRWLVFPTDTPRGEVSIVTQEEQWGIKGATPVLEVRWRGSISDASESRRGMRRVVILAFADTSTVALDPGRHGREALRSS